MRRTSGAVERRHVDPAIVRPEADAPDDAADPGRRQIERRRDPGRRLPGWHVTGLDGRLDRLLLQPDIDAALDAFIGPVRIVEIGGEIVREAGEAGLHARQRPVQRHALDGEAPQIDVAAAVAPGDVMVGLVAHPLAQRVTVHRQIVVAHQMQPFDHILATVEAGDARRAADAQMHLAAVEMQVLGDLRPRLSGADHQHGAGRQRSRVPIVRRMHLQDRRIDGSGERRDDRVVVAAGGDHHLVGLERSCAGLQQIAAGLATRQSVDRDAAPDRRIEAAHVVVEIGDDLVLDHEAIGIVAPIGMAGQGALPVRRDQAETVPALVSPGVAGRVAIQQHMIDIGALEMPAQRQSGLAGADDRHRDMRHGPPRKESFFESGHGQAPPSRNATTVTLVPGKAEKSRARCSMRSSCDSARVHGMP